ncbi:MAG: riboflavin synthase [Planctomycetota bacterium]|nr:riboflavin synthase [Planctomycetota bacterium]
MFTGLVETIGSVVSAERSAAGLRLRVDLGRAAEGVRLGDSIALSGVCQTVAGIEGTVAAFDAVAETLARTTVGRWQAGTRVNVERSLRPSDRLGGHFVAGHVDATGRVVESGQRPDGWWLRIEVPADLFVEIAPKGSIAIDGVSLTVVEAAAPVFSVTLIPTTLRDTTLGTLAAGDLVNIETDLLAKYVRRAIVTLTGGEADKRLLEALARSGFID